MDKLNASIKQLNSEMSKIGSYEWSVKLLELVEERIEQLVARPGKMEINLDATKHGLQCIKGFRELSKLIFVSSPDPAVSDAIVNMNRMLSSLILKTYACNTLHVFKATTDAAEKTVKIMNKGFSERGNNKRYNEKRELLKRASDVAKLMWENGSVLTGMQ